MKKLLILGGNSFFRDIVYSAKKMGLYTIVLDWNPLEKSPAKLIADEYSMLSLMDVDSVVDFIKAKGVDGVITGFSDSYLISYVEICKRTNLPCYLTSNTLAYTLNKRLFKKMCEKYGLGVIPEYKAPKDANDEQAFADKLPILIKPVDNCASRGIVKCSKPADLASSFQYALSFSEKKEILVEKYMQCDDISAAYVLRNGEIRLSAICDRYFRQVENGGSTTSGLIYPSKYLERYLNEVDPILKKMFSELGFKNGVLFLQAFVDDERFYFYEMGYRLSGGRHYLSTKNQNGVSALDMLINFAVTGDMGEDFYKENPYFSELCCQLGVLCDSQKIGKFTGLDEIRNLSQVFDSTTFYQKGDQIGKEGTLSQIVAKFHFNGRDLESLRETSHLIRDCLTIEDEEGRNIIQDFFI